MSSGDDTKKAKPFKEDAASVEARLAALEAEVAAKMELKTPEAHANLPEPVANSSPQAGSAKAKQAKEKSVKGTQKTVGGEAQGLHAPHINMIAFWSIAILSIVLSNVPGVDFLLTPVTQFVTMIHEGSHAIVALLTGGHPSMTIVSDGIGHGGITQPNGGLLFLTAQAGYLGTAAFGCFLIWLGQFSKYSRQILMGIGGMMLLSTLVFIVPGIFSATIFSSILSAMWGIFMGLSCIYMGKKLRPFWANLVVLFLAVQTALSSVSLAWILIPHALHLAGQGFSDATIMADHFLLPAVFWAMWWIVLSIAMLFLTLKYTYGKSILKNVGIPKVGKMEK